MNATLPTPDVATKTDTQTCRHHWVIEVPNGPLSAGRCKICGSVRDFCNNPEDARIDKPNA